MSVIEVLEEARELGIVIEAAGDKIKARRPTGVPSSFVEKLRAHKAELLRVLTVTDADLPARARQRVRTTCERIGVKPEPILQQFDSWGYQCSELRELLGWTEDQVRAHVELLADEVIHEIRP